MAADNIDKFKINIPQISLCMIVKNEEKYLRDCLKSVKGIVDEIILVDTGSSDNTINIAREFEAKVYHFNWINDFSAARNFSLHHASGEWILYLDADERLSGDSADELINITKKSLKSGYRCNVISIDDINKNPSVMSYVRLFPNNELIRFTGKIHEQIEFSIIQNNYAIEDSSIEIIHVGYNIPGEEIKKKAERNLPMLHKEYEESKTGYYAFQLGQTLGILGKKEEAEHYFHKALEAGPDGLKSEYRSVAYRYLAINNAERKEFDKSRELIEKSLEEDREQPLALMAAAKIFIHFKMNEKAVDAALRAYKSNKKFLEGKSLSAQNIMIDETDLCFHGLEIAISASDEDLFKFFYEKISKDNAGPVITVFNRIYSNIAVDDKEINVFISLLNPAFVDPLLLLLDKYIHTICKQKILAELSEKFNNNPLVHLRLGRLYLETGNNSAAEAEIEITVKLNPGEPSYYFYLVSAYVKNNNMDKLLTIITELEKRFAYSSEIISKVHLLKQKLSAHLTK